MQKFTILLSTLLACFFLLWASTLTAQVCQPDTTYKNGGFYPSSLPAGCIGQMYSETITIVVPVDTTVNIAPVGPITLPIDSIVIIRVKKLAPGLSYQCEPPSCGFPGGTSNCALISGIPTMLYSDSVEVVFDVYVTAPIVGQQIVSDSANLFEINIYETPVATATGTDANCSASDGTASVNVTGTGPFTYTWSNGGTTPNITGLAAGIYTVVVENAGGCSDTATVTINSIGGPTISGDTTVATTCFGGMDGSVSLGIAGGSNPLNFSWSNSATTQNLMGVPAGSYTLTVTDANNCVLTYSTTVPQPAQINPMIPTVNHPLCNGDLGSITIVAVGGTGTLTYSWNTTPVQTGSTASNLAPGMYTCTITDANGCSETASETLIEPTVMMLTVNGDSSLVGMPTGKAYVTATGGTPPYSYNWSTGENTDTISGKPAGVYMVIVTDANGCTSMDSIRIDNLLGLEDELAAGVSSLTAFPNPTTGTLSVRIELNEADEIELAVFDLFGKKVVQQSLAHSLDHQSQLELSGYPAGMYFLQVKTSNGMVSRRIVKE